MDVRSHPMRSVNTKLKELMKVALKEEFRFFEHYPRGDDGCFSTVIEAQNKLTDGSDKREQVNTALRDFREDTLRNSRTRENNHYGIRWETSVLEYKVPVIENGKLVKPSVRRTLSGWGDEGQ